MNDLQQSGADAKKFAAQFSGFLKACEALARIGDLDQAVKEIEQRLAHARSEEEAYWTSIRAQTDQLREQGHAEAAEIKAEAEKHASAVREEARQHAFEIRDVARQEADAHVSRKAQAAAQLDGVNEAIITRNAILDQLALAVADKTDKAVMLEATIQTLTAKRDDILAHIESLRAKF